MKHTIITDMGTGYSFDQIIENEIEYGPKWAELGWFEDDRFEEHRPRAHGAHKGTRFRVQPTRTGQDAEGGCPTSRFDGRILPCP